MQNFLSPKPILFTALDFETGNIDPTTSALTEYGSLFFFLQPGSVVPVAICTAGDKLNPSPLLSVTATAAKIQGRTMADIFSGKHKDEVLAFHEFRLLYESYDSPVIVSHNADFESGFLRAWAGRAGFPDWGSKKGGNSRRSLICTQRLTSFCRGVGILPPGENDFDSALKEFGLKREANANGTHSATEDARLTAALFCALYDLLRRYFGSVSPEALQAVGTKQDAKEEDNTVYTPPCTRNTIPYFFGQEQFRGRVLESLRNRHSHYTKGTEAEQVMQFVIQEVKELFCVPEPETFPESVLYKNPKA